MEQVSLKRLAASHLEKARAAKAGRSAETVYGGREHHLRQTVIAICKGYGLDEHESPGEATLQVLTGSLVLRTDSALWQLEESDIVAIPDEIHAVDATEDTVFLLTVSKRRSHEPKEDSRSEA